MQHVYQLLALRAMHKQVEQKPPRLAVVLVDMNYPKEDINPVRGTLEECIALQCRLLEAARRLGMPRAILREGYVVSPTFDALVAAAGPDAECVLKWEHTAFGSAQFVEFLDRGGINTLVLAGYELNTCLYKTAYDARRFGYAFMTAEDIILHHTMGEMAMQGKIEEGIGFYRKNGECYRTAKELMAVMERTVTEAATN